MRIIYFLQNGQASLEDKAKREKLKSEKHKVLFSNGSVPYGFEDNCDAVYLSAEFPLIENWALSKGIKIMKPEPVVAAKTEPVAEEQQEQTSDEEEVKPRRGRRKTSTEYNPS